MSSLYILFELRSPSSRPPTPGVVIVIGLHKPFNNHVERLIKQNGGQLLILVFLYSSTRIHGELRVKFEIVLTLTKWRKLEPTYQLQKLLV